MIIWIVMYRLVMDSVSVGFFMKVISIVSMFEVIGLKNGMNVSVFVSSFSVGVSGMLSSVSFMVVDSFMNSIEMFCFIS